MPTRISHLISWCLFLSSRKVYICFAARIQFNACSLTFSSMPLAATYASPIVSIFSTPSFSTISSKRPKISLSSFTSLMAGMELTGVRSFSVGHSLGRKLNACHPQKIEKLLFFITGLDFGCHQRSDKWNKLVDVTRSSPLSFPVITVLLLQKLVLPNSIHNQNLPPYFPAFESWQYTNGRHCQA